MGVAALVWTLQLDEEALRPENARQRRRSIRTAHAQPLPGTARQADEAVVQLLQQALAERRRQGLSASRCSLGKPPGFPSFFPLVRLRRAISSRCVRDA